jgi:sarcosine oxidase subunit delta
MRLPCPFCGDRDHSEFVYRGAAARRPAPGSDQDAFAGYVYMRENPAGELDEYWYHARGCRQWLIVRRDTRTHEIVNARLARKGAL